MIYVPSPKSLVYSELYFVSTAAPRHQAKISMDAIFDEVSSEIFALYVGTPVETETVAGWNFAGLFHGSEITN